MSKKRQALNVERREALEKAWGPRPWSCWLNISQGIGEVPWCYGEVNAHEIVKRSQGGSITDPSNMLPLCNFHNGWVETADRNLVWELGLVRSRWE
jgi:hypothetical protein